LTSFRTASGAVGGVAGGAGSFAALGGSLLGAALQLQQPTLWPAWLYAALLLAAVAGLAWRRLPARGLVTIALVCGTMAGAGLAGWRAVAYAQGALRPGLEGRDLQVTGVVAEMPQSNEAGVRFRLDVESARWADRTEGTPPLVPDRIALGWYAEDLADAPHAGERWRFTVRLKAPHGNRNPHGFDGELWMWEQGLHASGYVRTGARDAAPALLSTTWLRPVERARESVRDAVFARVPDRGQAGVIAALVTGDQSAIDRAGWDVFRATGVAHLMSISGLHITYMTLNLFLNLQSKPNEPYRDTVSTKRSFIVLELCICVVYLVFITWWFLPAIESRLRPSGVHYLFSKSRCREH
jgi:competence protein ComEC